jgi:hypothetical protein
MWSEVISLSDNEESKARMKQMLNNAIDSGAPPQVLKLQIDDMYQENRRQNLENTVRKDMGLSDKRSEEEPRSSDWSLEDMVRYKMQHPPSTEPEPPPNESPEDSQRRRMKLPRIKSDSEQQ